MGGPAQHPGVGALQAEGVSVVAYLDRKVAEQLAQEGQQARLVPLVGPEAGSVEGLVRQNGAGGWPPRILEALERGEGLALGLRRHVGDVHHRVAVEVAVVQHRRDEVGAAAVGIVSDEIVPMRAIIKVLGAGFGHVHERPVRMLLAHLQDPRGHVLLGHAALDVEGCPGRFRVHDVLLCGLHPVARVSVLATEREPVVMVVPSLAQNGRDLGTAEASGENRCGAPLVRVRGARGVCIHSWSHGFHEEFPIILTVAAPRLPARH